MCADQRTLSPEVREHLGQCEGCRNCQSSLTLLDSDLRRALELGPPFPRKKPQRPQLKRAFVLPTGRRRPFIAPRTWAMSASLVLAVLGGVLLWTARANDSLAQTLTNHVALEPLAWKGTETVPPETIDRVMRDAGLKLAKGQDRVVFARTCLVHGHVVPHLVVRTSQGPVAVVVMPDEPARASSSFHAGNVTGLVMPAPRGSIAVLTQQDVLSLDVAQELKNEVSWDLH